MHVEVTGVNLGDTIGELVSVYVSIDGNTPIRYFAPMFVEPETGYVENDNVVR